jgi:hypothetical protein
MAELAPKYLDTTLFRIVNGGIPETTRVGFQILPLLSSEYLIHLQPAP